MSGVRALQRQAQCYLVAMNTLRLVQPEYAWIIQPLLHSMEVSQLSTVLMGGGGVHPEAGGGGGGGGITQLCLDCVCGGGLF